LLPQTLFETLVRSRRLRSDGDLSRARSVNTPTKTRGVGAGKAADLTYWSAEQMVGCAVMHERSRLLPQRGRPRTRRGGSAAVGAVRCREGAARMIASVSTSSKIIVEKSTVPVKTAEAIEKVGVRRGLLPAHIGVLRRLGGRLVSLRGNL